MQTFGFYKADADFCFLSNIYFKILLNVTTKNVNTFKPSSIESSSQGVWLNSNFFFPEEKKGNLTPSKRSSVSESSISSFLSNLPFLLCKASLTPLPHRCFPGSQNHERWHPCHLCHPLITLTGLANPSTLLLTNISSKTSINWKRTLISSVVTHIKTDYFMSK